MGYNIYYMKTRNRGFSAPKALLVIVFIFALFLGVYLVMLSTGQFMGLSGDRLTSTSTPQKTIEQLTANWKIYNTGTGFSIKYPPQSTLTANNGVVNISVPFVRKYQMWTSKTVTVSITNDGSCDLPKNAPVKEINGTGFFYEDPAYGDTSGMSVVNKIRRYTTLLGVNCYVIEEKLSGLGNNERPASYTKPADLNAFFKEELMDLDTIVQTLVIFETKG